MMKRVLEAGRRDVATWTEPPGPGQARGNAPSVYRVEMPTLPVSFDSIPKLSLHLLKLTSEQWKQLLSGNEALRFLAMFDCSVILQGESHPLAEALTENQHLEAGEDESNNAGTEDEQ